MTKVFTWTEGWDKDLGTTLKDLTKKGYKIINVTVTEYISNYHSHMKCKEAIIVVEREKREQVAREPGTRGNKRLPEINRRFKFSEEYYKYFPLDKNRGNRTRDKRGIVLRETKNKQFYVCRLDGNAPSTMYTFAKSYIEFIDEEHESPGIS